MKEALSLDTTVSVTMFVHGVRLKEGSEVTTPATGNHIKSGKTQLRCDKASGAGCQY